MIMYLAKDGTEFASEEDAYEHNCWLDEMDQQDADEARWIDNGCQWPQPF